MGSIALYDRQFQQATRADERHRYAWRRIGIRAHEAVKSMLADFDDETSRVDVCRQVLAADVGNQIAERIGPKNAPNDRPTSTFGLRPLEQIKVVDCPP